MFILIENQGIISIQYRNKNCDRLLKLLPTNGFILLVLKEGVNNDERGIPNDCIEKI